MKLKLYHFFQRAYQFYKHVKELVCNLKFQPFNFSECCFVFSWNEKFFNVFYVNFSINNEMILQATY